MIGLVPLYRGVRLIAWSCIDVATAEAVSWERWHLDGSGYPANSKRERMHRYLVDVPAGFVIDHINRDKLDNRISNLRVVTQEVNTQNTPGVVSAASAFRGVYFDRRRRSSPWYVQVKHRGVKHHGGSFTTEQEAADAAERLRVEVFGEAPQLPVVLRSHEPPKVRDLARCSNGHLRSEENTFFTNGRPRCRECSRDYCRRYYQRVKAAS